MTNQKSNRKSSLFSSPKARAALQGRAESSIMKGRTNKVETSTPPIPNNNIGREAAVAAQMETEVKFQLISLAAIDPNPFYDMSFSEDKNEEQTENSRGWLVEKLAGLFLSGQMEEFVALVRPHPENPQRYQLAYGHLRVRAAAKAGLSQIAAVVKPLSDDEMLMRLVLENQNRANLSRVEMAAQVRYLRESTGQSFKALGELFNLPLATVYDLYYLSAAPLPFLQLVEAKPEYYQAVSEMVRRELDEEGQKQILKLLQVDQTSPRQLREKIRELLLVNQKEKLHTEK